MAQVNIGMSYRLDLTPDEYKLVTDALSGKPLSDEQKRAAVKLLNELRDKRKANAKNILDSLG